MDFVTDQGSGLVIVPGWRDDGIAFA